MSKHNNMFDPVNYQLTGDESAYSEGYKEFLDTLTDVPSSVPLHNLSIDWAGITQQKVIVQIEDIDKKGKLVPVVCDVSLYVDLHGHRGIHMSRCEEVLLELSKKSYKSLDEFSLEIASGLRKKQDSEFGIVKMVGTYLHHRPTHKSQRESADRIYLINDVKASDKEVKIKTGIKAYNMTACPCTRTYTKYSTVPALRDMGLTTEQIQKILEITLTGTHTQRGTITIIVDKNDDSITSGELYSILNDTTHLVFELLKRPDEHDLVTRALKKPQFTEDVVREVAYETYHRFHKAVPEDTQLFAESILNDSIHIHDVATTINKTFGEIKKEVK